MNRVIALSVTLLLVACTGSSEEDAVVGEVQKPMLSAEHTSLNDVIGGRSAIINFWASWCSFCKDELPLFQVVHQSFPEIAVIAVNLQEKDNVVQNYWNEGGYTFPTMQDPSRTLKKQFDVFTQPTTFFIDKQGNEIHRKDGPIDAEEMDEWVSVLLLDEVSGGDTQAGLEEREEETPNEPFEPSEARESIPVSPVPSILGSWYQGEVQHTIPLEEIFSGGPGKDGIPAIDDPKFINVDDVDFLEDNSQGLLLEIGDDVRFYPFNILNWHEIVNDTVGGRPVAITYCPLCASAVVFDRKTSEGVTTLGVSGMLYNSNLLMYDRNSESLWSQITGEASVGLLTGEKLTFVPSKITRWATVLTGFPGAKVLSTDTGSSRDYSRDPYGGYETEERVMFPVSNTDSSLSNKAMIYGVVIEGIPKAYPLSVIQEKGTISDQIGSVQLEVTWDLVQEFVTIENAQTGQRIAPMPSFWFSWFAQYPNTQLYGLSK